MSGSALSEIDDRRAELRERLKRARGVQSDWARTPIRDRLAVIRAARHAIAREARSLAAAIGENEGSALAERLSSEVLPLAEACRFLERRAPKLLRPRRIRRHRPLWLTGTRLSLRREALGCVLVIGASNYPLMLPGIQVIQALTAGNAVLLKPGRQGSRAATALAERLYGAGLMPDLLQVLDESEAGAQAAILEGVDKVVFTGSSRSGIEVLRQLALSATPSVVEMSGCDAVFIPDASRLDMAARALRFGLAWNASATCIAPRRVFAARSVYAPLLDRLQHELKSLPPLKVARHALDRVRELVDDARSRGADLVHGAFIGDTTMTPVVLAPASADMNLMNADIFAPILAVTPVDSDEQALSLADACPFALGASIFGEPDRARDLASRIRAGVVLINDMIVPTADPRLPFGGRGASGFGVTRGAEGLLEWTQLKAVVLRKGRWRPHFAPLTPDAADRFTAFIGVLHAGTLRERLSALARLLSKSAK